MNIMIKRKVVKKSYNKVILTMILIFVSLIACITTTYNKKVPANSIQSSSQIYSYAQASEVIQPSPTNEVIQPSPIPEMPVEENEEFQEEKVIKAINKYLGGLLKDKGSSFYKSGKKHNSNPMMLAAISIHETANGDPWQYIKGKKIPSLLVTCNNVCGMNKRKGFKSKGRYTKYDSIDQSIDDMAYWTKSYYIDVLKLNSISEIAKVYAPLNDYQNNTMGMSNESWPGSVTEKYKKILNDAK